MMCRYTIVDTLKYRINYGTSRAQQSIFLFNRAQDKGALVNEKKKIVIKLKQYHLKT